MKPPNYRLGTPEEMCGNCGAFNKPQSYCAMYKVKVQVPKVCDSWYPNRERKYRIRKAMV